MDASPQRALAGLAAERGDSLSALSVMLGRNRAYLQQYVERGSPRILPERERGVLAAYFGVEEATLGGPVREAAGDVAVPWLTVAASAGSGALGDAAERTIRALPVARALLRDLGVVPADASIIAVAGDSMAPTLLDGDRLLVDRADRQPRGAGGVYVVRRADALAVKRVMPEGRGWRVVSDNPAYPAEALAGDALAVVGRAKLLWRGL